jgi:hypothetical protein
MSILAVEVAVLALFVRPRAAVFDAADWTFGSTVLPFHGSPVGGEISEMIYLRLGAVVAIFMHSVEPWKRKSYREAS